MWYRTVPEMRAAGVEHLLVEMVDALEVAWKHTFPPGYTKVGSCFCADGSSSCVCDCVRACALCLSHVYVLVHLLAQPPSHA